MLGEDVLVASRALEPTGWIAIDTCGILTLRRS